MPQGGAEGEGATAPKSAGEAGRCPRRRRRLPPRLEAPNDRVKYSPEERGEQMKKLLLLLAMIAVAFSGCVEEKPSPEELKAMMIDSVDKIQTAAFAVDLEQTIKIVNLSETDRSLRTETFTTKSSGEGVLNVTARAMRMTMTTTSISDEMGEVTSEMEMYMEGDTMYTNVDGEWMKMPGMPEEMWDQQNQVKNQAELLNASNIELVGSEKVDGKDAFKVRVVPDTEAFTAILNQQMGSMPFYAMNMTDLFEDSEMEWTTWISKESGLPLKNRVILKLTLTSDMMGIPVDEMGDLEMIVDSDSTVIYSGYNEAVSIEIPDEAIAAPSWLDMLMAMMAEPSEIPAA